MSFSAASIVSVVIFIVIGYSCFRNGLFSTLATLFVIVLSAAVSVACFGPITNMEMVANMGEEARSFVPPLCWLGVFMVSLVIMQTVANFLLPPKLNLPKTVDVVGGALLGLVNAAFLTGFLMVGLDLFPGTGDPEISPGSKVVFLNVDSFCVYPLQWMSARTGSGEFKADEFMAKARREKYIYRARDRKEEDISLENSNCFRRLDILGKAIKGYADAEGGYPQSLKDLERYLPGVKYMSAEQIHQATLCPATEFPYVLVPVKNFRDVEGDKDYVLMYDAVAGQAGHLANGADQRPALFGDLRPRWVTDTRLKAMLEAQKNSLK